MFTLPRVRRAFTLIELVIVVVIIGIIAAIAVPRMSRGADNAAENALRANLTQLRNAVELFRTEVGSLPPSSTSTELSNALTQFRLPAGTFQATQPASGTWTGPYLRAIPNAPIGRTGVRGLNTFEIGTAATAPATAAGAWYFNSSTGEVRLNDSAYWAW